MAPPLCTGRIRVLCIHQGLSLFVRWELLEAGLSVLHLWPCHSRGLAQDLEGSEGEEQVRGF